MKALNLRCNSTNERLTSGLFFISQFGKQMLINRYIVSELYQTCSRCSLMICEICEIVKFVKCEIFAAVDDSFSKHVEGFFFQL